MLTVALVTVRTRWAAFAGTFAALALGVSVIATMTLVLVAASGGHPHQRPERFAGVPYVIQVNPDLTVRDRYGSLDSVPLLAQPDVPPSVMAQLPGAVADRSFYAQVEGRPAAQPALGHGWSSAAFAPYVLTSGHAPRSDDEIVVAGTAAVGGRVPVVTAAGSRTYTVVGTVRPRTGEQPVFFTDAAAARLSPGVDALVTGHIATAKRAAALPGVHLQVLTGADRHKADPGAVTDTTELTGLTSFLGVAALLSAFVTVTVTAAAFGLSVTQRRRDLALLRAIGATPQQVRRTICAEATLVGAIGSAAGCLIGLAGAPQLARWIVGQALAPSWFRVHLTADSVLALIIAFLAGVAVAVLSVLAAAVRAGTIRPAEALREAAAAPKRISRLRLVGGAVAVSGGAAALIAIALVFPSAATDPKTGAEIVILLIGGSALLSPILLRSLTRLFDHGTAGMLLRANISAGARRAAAAIVPVLITAGLTASILGINGTATAAASAAEHQQAARASFVVLPAGTPGLTAALLHRIHAIKGVEATAVTDTNLLASQPQVTALHLESPIPVPFPAMGIDQPSAALNVEVIAGSLAGLDDQTIAVGSSWHKRVGGTMRLWQNQAGLELLLGIAIVYSAIGLASTFLMSAAGRRSELVLLHKTGAIRRQIVWFVTAESLSITLIGIAVSAALSGLVLGGLYLALAGQGGSVSIVLPWPLVGAILGACVVIAVLTSAWPAWLQLRPRYRPGRPSADA